MFPANLSSGYSVSGLWSLCCFQSPRYAVCRLCGWCCGVRALKRQRDVMSCVKSGLEKTSLSISETKAPENKAGELCISYRKNVND